MKPTHTATHSPLPWSVKEASLIDSNGDHIAQFIVPASRILEDRFHNLELARDAVNLTVGANINPAGVKDACWALQQIIGSLPTRSKACSFTGAGFLFALDLWREVGDSSPSLNWSAPVQAIEIRESL
jgi:hypothetical protein